jgi:hypothetical protein
MDYAPLEDMVRDATIWIDSLKPEKGYLKTVRRLAVEQEDGSLRYCCIGVGAEVLGLHNREYLLRYASSYELAERVGMHCGSGKFQGPYSKISMCQNLAGLNDMHENDDDFARIRALILENLNSIFTPKVAEKLKTHYHGS